MEHKSTCNIDREGTERWYFDEKLHREDGPALTHYNGTKYWYRHGNLHRLDGPAVEYSDGDTYWYVNDQYINEHINVWAKQNGIDLENLTDVDKVIIKLIWADYGNQTL